MGLLTPVAVKVGSISWMPKLLPQIVWTDNLVHRLTKDRYGILDVAGLPNLVLTVPGRKSGIPRSTNLLTVPDGDEWLIAGSYFGAPKTPVWVANLRATETAAIRYRRRDYTVTWREMLGAEREQAWATMLATWPNFDKYAERTDRVIPVFRLTPV
ncbi:nitroreductase family deazaflavin-dependent oxidoreductase [Nocardioides antri]|uniref:Nitroreductase family deazaflavin-dependent oxidoreductase n=1 Tax=Nocardioides antri TaxID=2607659 RepID=A0A5B1M6W7_9ACTN|nr:nitroreductase family deazaflavin-dependent oxidoreductase [Nocardioides antri]KAA1428394.1 nitroreductase family deazaflavin-dependent oxidoreductase [Nocardioides antri]